ncbi:LysR substrate-binding domain-containing protein [Kiloniella laminariae]|uniref:LysR substrate-binding domain-containing protein n=1 Tax=Kiloniella laminariae TaxID=454162 RepID=A0ABT4LPI5_9PROT|nr:LysR substrate-binding domain-containing protein [Kiloniella laminariae]MCZ4283045.1 LysR substrate-binding domain-containing protein [Kiloniella laminariae]
MRKLKNLIQSPTALFSFEAAGRHLSFARAAEELNVSQAAVSYAIKQLESALNTQLFYRGHRSVQLTEAGQRFHSDVTMGLGHIHRSAQELSRSESDRNVTLSCSTAFANYWLVPRLASFSQHHPDIDIRMQTTDKDVDPAAEEIPLGIRRGNGVWPGHDAIQIAKEVVYPIASPKYLSVYGRPKSPQDLAKHRLLHLEEPYRDRPNWDTWFKAKGMDWEDNRDGLRFNDYALVIQTTLAGGGIALGWWHLVDHLVHHGLLKLVDDQPVHFGGNFWVLWPNHKPLSPQAEKVRDWLISNQESLDSGQY